MKIMLMGSGPERIGKTGELDRMANQAIEFLLKKGHDVVYIDSNPNCIASIARKGVAVYIEPLTLTCLGKIIEKERPDGILYAFGGRLASQLTILLEREGILDKHKVRVLGTPVNALKRILEEEIFINKLAELKIPAGKLRNAYSREDCLEARAKLGIPLLMRASFALEGEGGYLAYNDEEIRNIAPKLLNLSRVGQIILDRVEDAYNQVAMECFIDNTSGKPKVYLISTFENLEAGYSTHLGNTVVLSPSVTLKGDLLQKAYEIAATIAVEFEITGSYEIRFWYSANTKEICVHRLIPYVSRFSSFGTLARGVRVAEMNVCLYLGLPIRENDTRNLNVSGVEQGLKRHDDANTKAVRIPVFSDELQRTQDLKTVMNATGARIYLGKTYEELIGKVVDCAVQSAARNGDNAPGKLAAKDIMRLFQENRFSRDDMKDGHSHHSDVNPAFLASAGKIAGLYNNIRAQRGKPLSQTLRNDAHVYGFSDELIRLVNEEKKSREKAKTGTVDGLLLKTTSTERKIDGTGNLKGKALLVLGPGPYAIGWGPEIDIALVQTIARLKEQNWKTVLLNDNPDGVSLEAAFFDAVCVEAVTTEKIETVIYKQAITAVVHQFCPHIPTGLPELLQKRNVLTIGTPIPSMAVLRDVPKLWKELGKINVPLLPYHLLHDRKHIMGTGTSMGFPLLARLTDKYINPVAGVIYDKEELNHFLSANEKYVTEENPLFLEKYQEGLTGAEILAIGDGEDACVLGCMEHIEEYGVHSDDCASIIPMWSIGDHQLTLAEDALNRIVNHFALVGHIKLSLAVRGREVFVTGVSPYPGRNILYLEKAFANPLHDWTAQVFAGTKIKRLKDTVKPYQGRCYVKESVFPFKNFASFDPILTPRMISTGQVMGQNENYGKAFLKAQTAINPITFKSGKVFLSGRDNEKEAILQIAKKLVKLGYHLTSTQGTARFLHDRGLEVETVYKVSGSRPNIRDLIINDKISLLVNIPGGSQSKKDEELIRRAAIEHNVPLFTTISGALLMVRGIEELRRHGFTYDPLYSES